MKIDKLPDYLPNLPDSFYKIQQFFLKNDADINELVSLVEADSLLCANILKIANSAAYGGRKKIVSISQAIARLGLIVTRGIIMAAFVKKSFPIRLDVYEIDMAYFDKINQTRLYLLKKCFFDSNLNMEILKSVTILLESSKIVTAYLIDKENQKSYFKSLLKEKGVKEAEEAVFGVDGYKIGAMLFEKWKFEKEFVDLIKNIYNPKKKEGEILLILTAAANIDGILETKNKESMKIISEKYGFDWGKISKCIDDIVSI